MSDLARKDVSADCCILASGALRADSKFPAEHLYTYGEMFDIYPLEKELCLVQMKGEDLYRGLESGVSKYPGLDGRFPQVFVGFMQTSNIYFEFNPHHPVGERVRRDSIKIAGEPLVLERCYKVAMCNFLAAGKDGYESFKDKKELIDANTRQQIRSVIIDFLSSSAVTRIPSQSRIF